MLSIRKSLFLNASYLFISSLYTYSSWVYKGTPSIQLLLQSVLKMVIATCICKMKTGAVPKLTLYDKYLFISAILFTCSSFCTFEIWNMYEMSPYVYSMGTAPCLFVADVLQNGRNFQMLSSLTLLSWVFVDVDTLPWFLTKCILSSLASYTSSIGLGFSQSSGLQERSSKVISFSLISALIPLFWLSIDEIPKNQMLEYGHAFLGAASGLMTAFVLSYNGAVTKVGIASAKDFVFLWLQHQYLTTLSIALMLGKCVVSSIVSLRRDTPASNEAANIEIEPEETV